MLESLTDKDNKGLNVGTIILSNMYDKSVFGELQTNNYLKLLRFIKQENNS